MQWELSFEPIRLSYMSEEITSKPKYYSVGYNQQGRLVVFPVLVHAINMAKIGLPKVLKFQADHVFDAATRSDVVLAQTDGLMDPKNYTYCHDRNFQIKDGHIHSNSASGAHEGLLEIMMLMGEK